MIGSLINLNFFIHKHILMHGMMVWFADLTADVSDGAQLVIYVHYLSLSDMEEQFLSC
jgi:hypothetical protein